MVYRFNLHIHTLYFGKFFLYCVPFVFICGILYFRRYLYGGSSLSFFHIYYLFYNCKIKKKYLCIYIINTSLFCILAISMLVLEVSSLLLLKWSFCLLQFFSPSSSISTFNFSCVYHQDLASCSIILMFL